jgi:HlyD family secretion protein
MSAIELGTLANIVLTAYEEDVYQAIVTDVSEATYNSSLGENEYSVTVTIEGQVEGLYQGMTGDVTFITKESEEVLYVSNRAITREGTCSYVKVKEEDGNLVTKEIVTGFSDGINVEIVEGLSEGDIVLIESKVTE